MADQHPGARPGDHERHDAGDQPRPGPVAGGDVSNTMSGGTADNVLMGRDFYFNPPALGEPERVPVYLPHLVGGLFTGREAELAQLDDAFAPASKEEGGGEVRSAVVHQRVGAVHGLGGIGKSTLAAHWAATRRERGGAVWWITADTPANLHQGLAALATAARPELAGRPLEVLTEHAIGWLNTHRGWVLVLDNVTRPGDITPVLARLRVAAAGDGAGDGGGRVLVTSRLATGWEQLADYIIGLDVLPLGQAVDLLGRTVAVARPDVDEAGLEGAEELCVELGCLPLAIGQAAGYLIEHHCTPRAYLDRLGAYPARLYAHRRAGSDDRDVDRTVARVWHATLDHLTTHTPLAGPILRILAWWSPDHIPRTLLDGLADLDEHVAQQGGVLGVQDAVARLAAYNMITLSPDGHSINVHRLVQAVARTPAPDDIDDPHRRSADIDAARDLATALLYQARPDDPVDPAGWPMWRTLLPHIDALTAHARPEHDTPAFSFLLDCTATFLQDQGALTRAIGYFERALTADRRLHGDDHLDTLASRHNLAVAYRDAGELERAIALDEQTLADLRRVLGDDHPHTLASRHSLAVAYHDAGDLERAIPLLEQTLADRVRVLGDDHPDTLNSRNNLAVAYHEAGTLERVIPLLEQTLADFRRVLGDDHPNTLASRNNLAGAYHDAGDLERAITLHEQTLADCRRVLGDDHPNTLLSRDWQASLAWESGDLGRAVVLYRQLLADCERVLGTNHPATKDVRSHLKAALRQQDGEGPPPAL
ncbi:FxSxx-COOH system tetratricopeptide repeat protein [Spirillospora sp. NPDC050679]